MAYLKDFIEHCVNNSTETMEYYDDIIITREYNAPEMENFRKIVNEHFNRFCFSNGLFQKNRLDLESLKGQEEAFMILIGVIDIVSNDARTIRLPKNRYLQQILKFYFGKRNSKIEDVKLEDIRINFNENGQEKQKWIMDDYYSDVPPIYAKIPKIDKNDLIRAVSVCENNNIEKILKYLKEIILIGSSIQFNVDGFPRNEMLYLLYGLAIVSASRKDFKNFKDLVNYLKSFIQLYLTSKCFNPIPEHEEDLKPKDKDNYYNLVTFLKVKGEQGPKYNYRYACAAKYFDEKIPHSIAGNTKMVKSEDGSEYLLTIYKSKEEMEKVWNELEEEYLKSKISNDLIKKWFDGQLLTRSTCLVGCMLIIMKELGNGKRVIFKKDEMPDWCSIAGLEFTSTYDVEDWKIDGETNDALKTIKDLKLSDVLDVLKIYVLNVRKA